MLELLECCHGKVEVWFYFCPVAWIWWFWILSAEITAFFVKLNCKYSRFSFFSVANFTIHHFRILQLNAFDLSISNQRNNKQLSFSKQKQMIISDQRIRWWIIHINFDPRVAFDMSNKQRMSGKCAVPKKTI